MDSSRSRATHASHAKSQPDAKLDFSNRMARAKAAMLAREHKYHPSSALSVPEIVVTSSLDTVLESDEEKP